MIPLENFTGDLPTPIKYFNSEITHAYKDIEAAAELHLISLLRDLNYKTACASIFR